MPSYQVKPEPVPLQQQATAEKNVKEGDVLEIVSKPQPVDGEWIVTAVGQLAILAVNPKSNVERAFPDQQFFFKRRV